MKVARAVAEPPIVGQGDGPARWLPDTATRSAVASCALGVGFGLVLAYFFAYAWVRPDFYGGTVMAGPVWFVPAWLLLVATSTARTPAVRYLGGMIAAATFLAVPLMKVGPFLRVPWGPHIGTMDPAGNGFGFVWKAQILPASSGTIAVLLALALLTLTGRAAVRPTAEVFAASSAIFGVLFGLAVALARWPDYFTDADLWRSPAIPFQSWPASPGIGVLVVLLGGVALALRRRSSTAALLATLGALTLLAGVIAFNLSGPVGTGL